MAADALFPARPVILYFAMPKRITVNVPATTANLGPGFDCLGMALDVWNTITFTTGESGFSVSGQGADDLPAGRGNFISTAFDIPFEKLGTPVPEVGIACHNRIPVGRGLGSSSAAVVAGVLAANELSGNPFTQEDLLAMAADAEGHADNVASAILGGLQVVVRGDDGIVTSSVPLPKGLDAVLFVPDQPVVTEEARALLSPRIDRNDAVFNIGRVGLLVNALATGDLALLRTATEDRLHQQRRERIFPAMRNILRAALDAGALGAFLSGSGSTVLAFANSRRMTIGYEMAEAASKLGVSGEFRVTSPSAQGARLYVEDE